MPVVMREGGYTHQVEWSVPRGGCLALSFCIVPHVKTGGGMGMWPFLRGIEASCNRFPGHVMLRASPMVVVGSIISGVHQQAHRFPSLATIGP